MRTKRTHQYAFATLLLLISILCLTPTLAHADQQSASTPVAINATGQATTIGSGTSGAATLTLNGSGYVNSNRWLIIQNTTGSLQISSTTYTITSGKGSVSNFGQIAVFANTNAGQLMLYGTMKNSSVSFDAPSQLTSVASLSLTGTINQAADQALSQAANVTITNSANNVTATTLSTMNATQTSNSTGVFSFSTSISSNSTQSTVTNGTTSMATSTTANSSLTTSLTLNNSTNSTTLTGSGNVPVNPPTQGNVTITVTQYINQTISSTQTVANVTVSYTATTTVANTTLTVGNVTTTVTATTGT